MALTAISFDGLEALQVPRVLAAAVAIDTGHAKGVALTMSDGMSRECHIVGDADWYWSQTDNLAVASMQMVLKGEPLVVRTVKGQTLNFYGKTASAANLVVSLAK